MKIHRIIILAAASGLLLVSCKCRTDKGADETGNIQPSERPTPGLNAIDSLPVGEPYRLCIQTLTSADGICAAFPDSCASYDVELTPVRETFFFPEKDIKTSGTVDRVRIRYNCASVFNRVAHGIQWYLRVSSSPDDTLVTLKDTLGWVAASQPGISTALLSEVIPDAGARKAAAAYLSAYSRFKGDIDNAPQLNETYNSLKDIFSGYDKVSTEDMLETFENNFWQWYDKAQFVPGVDEIIRMNLKDTKEGIDEEHLEHFRKAVLSEKDIDRRAVLALEYVKFDGMDGTVFLGEILESGLYTRYILETWISWRAHVQMNHAMSSFSVIPDNYYDKIRVKCINTLLRHYQESGDPADLCLVENFIGIPVLQRQGSYFGNESLATVAGLNDTMFIHPRVSGDDYLKSE